jgi:peptidoglycan/LPS O-acetylase OafA/YrhL
VDGLLTRMTEKANRIRGLDSLRGFAAVAVMLFHFTWVNAGPGLAPFRVKFGRYGVELFFVISGFVIFMTLERSRSVRDFAVSRIARLYPAYWAAIALTTALAWLLERGPSASLPSPLNVAVNLTMLQEYFGFQDVDNSYWTLAVELQFYVLIGLVSALGRIRDIEWLSVGWLLLAATLRVLSRHGLIALLPAPWQQFLDYSQFFILGIVVYLLSQGRARPITIVLGALAWAMSLTGGSQHSNYASPLIYFLVTGGCGALVWVATGPALPALKWPLLLFFGDISYPLYLLHQRIGATLSTVGYEAGLSPTADLAVSVVIVVAAAWAIHKVIEYRGGRWLRQRLGSNRPAQVETNLPRLG